jgi:hypothetical protein
VQSGTLQTLPLNREPSVAVYSKQYTRQCEVNTNRVAVSDTNEYHYRGLFGSNGLQANFAFLLEAYFADPNYVTADGAVD